MMPYDDPNLKEFAGYFQAKELGSRERAENWAIAIGLQKEGVFPYAGSVREVNLKKHEWVLRGDSVTYGLASMIRETLDYDFAPLEKFFRNLILGETNELQSRYLLVGLKSEEKAELEQGCQKMLSEKVVRKHRIESLNC